MCRLRVSGAQSLAYWGCAGCCGGRLTVFAVHTPPSSGRPQPASPRFRVREAQVACPSSRCPGRPPHTLPHTRGSRVRRALRPPPPGLAAPSRSLRPPRHCLRPPSSRSPERPLAAEVYVFAVLSFVSMKRSYPGRDELPPFVAKGTTYLGWPVGIMYTSWQGMIPVSRPSICSLCTRSPGPKMTGILPSKKEWTLRRSHARTHTGAGRVVSIGGGRRRRHPDRTPPPSSARRPAPRPRNPP